MTAVADRRSTDLFSSAVGARRGTQEDWRPARNLETAARLLRAGRLDAALDTTADGPLADELRAEFAAAVAELAVARWPADTMNTAMMSCGLASAACRTVLERHSWNNRQPTLHLFHRPDGLFSLYPRRGEELRSVCGQVIDSEWTEAYPGQWQRADARRCKTCARQADHFPETTSSPNPPLVTQERLTADCIARAHELLGRDARPDADTLAWLSWRDAAAPLYAQAVCPDPLVTVERVLHFAAQESLQELVDGPERATLEGLLSRRPKRLARALTGPAPWEEVLRNCFDLAGPDKLLDSRAGSHLLEHLSTELLAALPDAVNSPPVPTPY